MILFALSVRKRSSICVSKHNCEPYKNRGKNLPVVHCNFFLFPIPQENRTPEGAISSLRLEQKLCKRRSKKESTTHSLRDNALDSNHIARRSVIVVSPVECRRRICAVCSATPQSGSVESYATTAVDPFHPEFDHTFLDEEVILDLIGSCDRICAGPRKNSRRHRL